MKSIVVPPKASRWLLGLAVVVPQLLVPFTAATSCTGPKTPGELRDSLWGPGSGYDRFTRPGVALAAANNNNILEINDGDDGSDTADNADALEPYQADPDIVKAQLHVLALTNVDQKRNEYQINIWFRIRWNDARLKHLSDTEGGCFSSTGREGYDEALLNEIWHPDIYVENQVKIDQAVAGSVWVYPSGDVVHVRQLLITLSCDMDFDQFPYDEQTCGFKIGTWLEDARGVTMDFWSNGAVTLASEQAKSTTQLPQGGTNEWKIKSAVGVEKEDGNLHGATQAESSVELLFVLERVADYYSDFVILPAVMFVTIGWFSFFISRGAAPARVAMSIIGFLANTNFLAAQLSQLPRLGNEVLLLRFLYLSTIFSFYSVLEYVVCNYLFRIEARVEKHRPKAEEHHFKENPPAQNDRQVINNNTIEAVPAGSSDVPKKRKKKSKKTQGADVEQPLPPPPPPAPKSSGNNDNVKECTTSTKKDFIASGFDYRVDSYLLNSKGQMIIRDEHVDIFSRFVYPISYIVLSCVIWFA